MGYACKVLKDSISFTGIRLITLEVTFPRIVLAEFNTHRALSRNSASSRAIPIDKMIARVLEDPFIPVWWGKNQKGMQASEELAGDARKEAEGRWLDARNNAVASVKVLQSPHIDLHKQIANRLLEPWLWQTVIVTATDWANFFALRCHPAAQPEIRATAEMMRDAMNVSTPEPVPRNGWHLPLIDPEDVEAALALDNYDPKDGLDPLGDVLARASCARCARVSYLTHDGRRDLKEDLSLADRLRTAGHMSPFEHAAKPMSQDVYRGNFHGWLQYRKLIPGEAIYSLPT
jgi:thymidylate synthase ThyX